jgi:nucleoside diphosphate kinase
LVVERTLILIKPHAVGWRLVAEILAPAESAEREIALWFADDGLV